jgi:hypothetical protein
LRVDINTRREPELRGGFSVTADESQAGEIMRLGAAGLDFTPLYLKLPAAFSVSAATIRNKW